MLQDWENGLVGNNPGTTSRLPRAAAPVRKVVDLLAVRRARGRRPAELPSAA
ncbi:hypothetical protein GRI40_09595 [Altererythrobacter aerius]|uniref:Uncharacterized protein n=1 Tax=Tsuneonella aeria TaxID=1837929 RepID=A0A6I4TFU0_9SPHN|nr:hypothetical protein [Tsuneonella aeria]MXO75467.1 hypothetical protein [Tsuneonella aeria]